MGIGEVAKNCMKKVIKNDGEKEQLMPVIWYCGERQGIIDYSGVWSLESDKVARIEVSKELIRECGSINQLLVSGVNIEYLARLVRVSGSCKIIADTNMEESEEDACELARTYAYMVRSHLDYWNAEGLTEQLLGDVVALMESYGLSAQFQCYMDIFLNDICAYERLACQTAPYLILRGDAICYGVLQSFADELGKALVSKGHSVITIGSDPDIYELLVGRIFKGIIGFQTRALEIDFFKKLRGPKFQFWTDYPLHYKGILRRLSKDYFVLCQDGDYASLIRDFYHTTQAVHFPPGGIAQEWNDRDSLYDVVFMGSYFRDAVDELDDENRQFYEYMLHHSRMNFEDGLASMLGYGSVQNVVEIGKANNDIIKEFEAKIDYLKPACMAVRGYFRKKVVRTLVDAGIAVHVYGEDWNNLDISNHESLIVHRNVSVEESLQELSKAKIGLNVMSWHKDGMTEKIANIMLSGAVCLSDRTKYLDNNLEDNTDSVLFDLDEIDELPKRVRGLLSDDSKRQEIARRGYGKAIQEFTWEKRAEQLNVLSEEYYAKDISVKVFVAVKDSLEAQREPIFCPIQVGCVGLTGAGCIGDNNGENISDLYGLYGCLTGLFWVWQNVRGYEYIGFCDRNSYMLKSGKINRWNNWKESNEGSIVEQLRDVDLLIPEVIESNYIFSDNFSTRYSASVLDEISAVVSGILYEYADAWDHILSNNRYVNCVEFITRAEIYNEYAGWLFDILVEISERIEINNLVSNDIPAFECLAGALLMVFAEVKGLVVRYY